MIWFFAQSLLSRSYVFSFGQKANSQQQKTHNLFLIYDYFIDAHERSNTFGVFSIGHPSKVFMGDFKVKMLSAYAEQTLTMTLPIKWRILRPSFKIHIFPGPNSPTQNWQRNFYDWASLKRLGYKIEFKITT